jgi:hypothetical protein
MVLIKAKVVDPTHLELSVPIEAITGRTVMVSLHDAETPDIERQDWLMASASALEAAYGEDEPEYPASMLRERNDDYHP